MPSYTTLTPSVSLVLLTTLYHRGDSFGDGQSNCFAYSEVAMCRRILWHRRYDHVQGFIVMLFKMLLQCPWHQDASDLPACLLYLFQ